MPVLARGVNSELFAGYYDNTDVGIRLAAAMHLKLGNQFQVVRSQSPLGHRHAASAPGFFLRMLNQMPNIFAALRKPDTLFVIVVTAASLLWR